MHNALQLDTFGKTDPGRVLKTNTDHFLIGEFGKSLRVGQSSLPVEILTQFDEPACDESSPQGQLLLVADGQATEAVKDQASQLAVTTIAAYMTHVMPWLASLREPTEDQLAAEWQAALERCQQQIRAHSNQGGEGSQATVTLAYLYLQGPQAAIVHVGSGRAYLWRANQLHHLTKDHTVAQQLQDAGLIGREVVAPFQTQPHVQRVWNTLGGNGAPPQPEVHRMQLEAGDVLVLASDGLCRHLEDAEISAVLQATRTAAEAAEQLVQLANDNGGTDNTTAVVARLVRVGAARIDTHAAQQAFPSAF